MFLVVEVFGGDCCCYEETPAEGRGHGRGRNHELRSHEQQERRIVQSDAEVTY